MCMKEKKKELLLATKNKLMKTKDGKYWIGFKCFEQNDLHEYLSLHSSCFGITKVFSIVVRYFIFNVL